MKKLFVVILTLCLMFGVFACGEGTPNTELTAKEGEPANGFLWENNYSEITITGYVGSSNDIVIPSKINGKSVTQIKSEAFDGFEAMKSLVIPGSVKKIDGAFRKCTGLKSVTLNAGLESMQSAFVECTALEQITIPATVNNMKSAFSNCANLKTVNIPEGITDLTGTFINCASIETLTLPESYVTSFNIAGMKNLRKLTMSEKALEASLGATCDHSWTVETDTSLPEYQTLMAQRKNLSFIDEWNGRLHYYGTCVYESIEDENYYFSMENIDDGIHSVCNETTEGLKYYNDTYFSAYCTEEEFFDESAWCVIKESYIFETVYISGTSAEKKTPDNIEVNDQIYTVKDSTDASVTIR